MAGSIRQKPEQLLLELQNKPAFKPTEKTRTGSPHLAPVVKLVDKQTQLVRQQAIERVRASGIFAAPQSKK